MFNFELSKKKHTHREIPQEKEIPNIVFLCVLRGKKGNVARAGDL